jgi:hypothetical protein
MVKVRVNVRVRVKIAIRARIVAKAKIFGNLWGSFSASSGWFAGPTCELRKV